MKKFAIAVILVLLNYPVFGEDNIVSRYEDRGNRDPFCPLVDADGHYLLEAEDLNSSSELQLFGILWDERGNSTAIINNQVVKEGESIGGFTVKEISMDSVTVFKEEKEYILKSFSGGEI